MNKIRPILLLSLLGASLWGCGGQNSHQACTDLQQGKFIDLPSGTFVKAFDPQNIEEGHEKLVSIDGFSIQYHEVTNAQFAAFVEATGYITDAEKNGALPNAGSALFSLPSTESAGFWALVKGATWQQPNPKETNVQLNPNHPVVHVSYRDATAYANWVGARLPTENEWEYAAQRGLPDPTNSSSGAIDDSGIAIANTWQGVFPIVNTATDGYASIAPIGCYPASEVGLYDMIGNVWEWTSTPFNNSDHLYTIKGGSFLCANNFCQRYRPAARQSQEENFSTNHIGFRVVKDLQSHQ